MIEDKRLHAAIDAIARTEHGHTLYLFLQKRLMAIQPLLSDGALYSDHGERTFASKLIGLMATGIRESGGSNTSTDDTGSVSPDQPIVFAVSGPKLVARSGGAGRRITADTHVPGYSGSGER